MQALGHCGNQSYQGIEFALVGQELCGANGKCNVATGSCECDPGFSGISEYYSFERVLCHQNVAAVDALFGVVTLLQLHILVLGIRCIPYWRDEYRKWAFERTKPRHVRNDIHKFQAMTGATCLVAAVFNFTTGVLKVATSMAIGRDFAITLAHSSGYLFGITGTFMLTYSSFVGSIKTINFAEAFGTDEHVGRLTRKLLAGIAVMFALSVFGNQGFLLVLAASSLDVRYPSIYGEMAIILPSVSSMATQLVYLAVNKNLLSSLVKLEAVYKGILGPSALAITRNDDVQDRLQRAIASLRTSVKSGVLVSRVAITVRVLFMLPPMWPYQSYFFALTNVLFYLSAKGSLAVYRPRANAVRAASTKAAITNRAADANLFVSSVAE